MLPYKQYDLLAFLYPIWAGNFIYNESVLFVGKDDRAPLLYKVEKIISVMSHDLRTEYAAGRDFIYKDGLLGLTGDTAIPFMTLGEYYPETGILLGNPDANVLHCNRPDHRYLVFGEGDTFTRRQVVVTYQTKDAWNGFIPAGQPDRFARLFEKMAAKRDVTVVTYGDSVAAGGNSSGMLGIPPYAEDWSSMTVSFLKRYFQTSRINLVNAAVGGTTVRWAIDQVDERVNRQAPDLVMIRTGGNDPRLSPQGYQAQMTELVEKIRAANPDCAVLLVSLMHHNREATGFFGNQIFFEEPLLQISREYPQTAVAPLTSMQAFIQQTKRFRDMTGNNVNHANDFLARIHAQVILKTMLGDRFDRYFATGC